MVSTPIELNDAIVKNFIEKLKKGEPIRYDRIYEIIGDDSLEKLKHILKAAFELAEKRVIIYGCLYTKFWKDFYEIFREIHDRGVEVVFILDPRCKEKIGKILEELPWIREVGKLMIGAETTEARRHFELVDDKFLRLEKPHEVPIKKGDIIENKIESQVESSQLKELMSVAKEAVLVTEEALEVELLNRLVELLKPWLEIELLNRLVFSREDLLPIEEREHLGEVEDRIKVILPELLKDVLQKIRNKISEYDADVDVCVLEDPIEGTLRFIILIVGDFSKTLTEKVEFEDEIEAIIDDVIKSWKEKAESEIDREIIENIGLLIDVLIQDRHPKDSEIVFIDLNFTEKDLEDKLEDLIRLTGDEKKAKEIKEKIREIVIEEVKKSGKPYDDSGIKALTNLLCAMLIKEANKVGIRSLNDL